MLNLRKALGVLLLSALLSVAGCLEDRTQSGYENMWSHHQAWQWYNEQPWLVGCNYLPSTASNQLEMWQEETFDPETIDRELRWACEIGFNIVRVFLNDMVWEQDPKGFVKRIDKFLEIADKHNIKVMPVLLDSCWDPRPKLGKQPEPIPHVHNSRWVQSPHIDVLKDPSNWGVLKEYVQGIVKRYRNDDRILLWDIFNEPGNSNTTAYGHVELENKEYYALELLKQAFKWTREMKPTQPLTVCVWFGDWRKGEDIPGLNKFALENSDINQFHTYRGPKVTLDYIKILQEYNRPIICGEYMSRGTGSTFENILPIFKEHNIAAICWGLVAGRSQANYPWDSWTKKYTSEPELWFHDIFRKDGTPYIPQEVEFIKAITSDKELKSQIKIDFGREMGPATHRFSGFLCTSIWADEPSEELVAPLKPSMIQGYANWVRMDKYPGVFAPGLYERLVEKLGMQYQIRITSTYGLQVLNSADHKWFDKPGPLWPGDEGDWSRWENFLTELVSRIKKNQYKVVYDIWNEPDGAPHYFWNRPYKQYLEAYRRGALKIRQLDPDAEIMGPSFTHFNKELLEEWVLWAKQNNVLPDILCWHFPGSENIDSQVDQMEKFMAQNNIDIDKISIAEMIGPSEKFNPSAAVARFANLERCGPIVINAGKACWADDKEDIPMDSYCGCNMGRLNHLLTRDLKRRSMWWAYKAYADVAGTLVEVTPDTDNKIDAVAGYDLEKYSANIVIGNDSKMDQQVTVTFTNMDKLKKLIKNGYIHVTAEHIPLTGAEPLEKPVTTVDSDYMVLNSRFEIKLYNFGSKDAYTIRLTKPK